MSKRRKTKDNSLNLGEFGAHLAKKFGMPKRFADDILKETFSTIIEQLNQKRKVKIRGFGTFEMRKSWGKPRPKFNPSINFKKPLKQQ